MMELGIAAILLLVGLGAGRIAERRHLGNLTSREHANAAVLITDIRTYPGGLELQPPPTLVVAETVISSDYFKSFVATLRRIIGGELRSFESLMLRARREAMAQLAEQARAKGYDAVCNIRMEGIDITGGTRQQRGVIVVSLQASGTAYRRRAGART
jgi:uncharacterized protein YbjQ (UPF0145 family)